MGDITGGNTDPCRRLVGLFLCIGILLLLTGCWDSRELNQRAVIAAMGIDKGDVHRYEVSFQVIVADEIAGEKARGAAPVVLYREEGDTIFEAVRKASRKVSRQISLSHVRAVVISEEMARKGISHLVDFLERDAETRLTIEMYIARGHLAREVLSTMTSVGRIPANDITGKQQMSMRMYGETYTSQIDQVIRDLSGHGKGPVIPGLRVSGDMKKAPTKDNVDSIEPKAVMYIQGSAIFQGDKLVGWMDGREAIGLSILHNKLQSSVTPLPYDDRPEAVTIETIFLKSRTLVSLEKGEPVFTIEVDQNGAAGEVDLPLNLNSSRVIEKMQRKWSAETADYVRHAVRAAQAAKTDVLGFGRVVERKYPQQWKKLSEKWGKEFPECTVHIRVTSVIKNTQTRKNPYLTH
ncbi:Ger(x)C family spore germination protein [Paenibacillus jiagnxiensis]|uniref:Ger(x)C family spore germination protein n=1 Tax=Paenibacillus jiagnxiensis TaxID=3228926 RepID=UPI0033B225F8